MCRAYKPLDPHSERECFLFTSSIFSPRRTVLAFFSATIISAQLSIASLAQAPDPFTDLRGSWGGNGTMTMTDGAKERLACSANYSGSSSQLRLSIKCKNNKRNIDMNGQLSANSGKLLGTWEEKSFKAIGSISGIVDGNKIKFYIGGNVIGSMLVTYSKTSQNVVIRATGITLKDVTIKLKRR